MARDVTITFADGSTHVYQNAPDDITPEAVQSRAEQDFGKSVTNIDGGKKQQQSGVEKQTIPDWGVENPNLYSAAKTAREYLGPTVEAALTAGGGIVGSALGPAGTVGGAGLGYGIGSELNRLAGEALGVEKPKSTGEALLNAAENVTSGALLEGALPAVKGVFGNIYKRAQDQVAESSAKRAKRILEASLGEDVDAAKRILQASGESKTAAQALAEGGINSPAFQALYSDVVGATPKSAKFFSQQALQREAERQAALRGVTPNLEEAVAAREAATKPLYKEAMEARLPGRERLFQPKTVGRTSEAQMRDMAEQPLQREVSRNPLTNEVVSEPMTSVGNQPITVQAPAGYTFDKDLAPLMDRPVVQSAFKSAEEAAANKGKSIYDAQGKLTGEGAHAVKLALDDAISMAPTDAKGANAQAAMMDARQQFLGWLEKKVPVYEQARTKYAELSAPVNQAKILNQLSSVLEKSTGGERVTPFMDALNRGEVSLLKKANQQPRFGGIQDVLSPEQMGAVNRVSGELVGEQAMKRQASEGKQALATLLDSNIPKFNLPSMLSRPVMLLRSGISELEKRIGSKTMEILTEGMKSGKNLDEILSSVHPWEKNRVERLIKNPDLWLGKQTGIPSGIRSALSTDNQTQRTPPRTLADVIAEKEAMRSNK